MDTATHDGRRGGNTDGHIAISVDPDHVARLRPEYTAAQVLCRKLLTSALEDVQHKDEKISTPALHWLLGSDALVSCGTACEFLGIDHGAIISLTRKIR